jgi:hypothetical protein
MEGLVTAALLLLRPLCTEDTRTHLSHLTDLEVGRWLTLGGSFRSAFNCNPTNQAQLTFRN